MNKEAEKKEASGRGPRAGGSRRRPATPNAADGRRRTRSSGERCRRRPGRRTEGPAPARAGRVGQFPQAHPAREGRRRALRRRGAARAASARARQFRDGHAGGRRPRPTPSRSPRGSRWCSAQFQQVLQAMPAWRRSTRSAIRSIRTGTRRSASTNRRNIPRATWSRQVRKGYKLKDRLLRAASVFVAKPSEGKQAKKN